MKKCEFGTCQSRVKLIVSLFYPKTKDRRKVSVCKKHYESVMFQSEYDTTSDKFIQEKLDIL